MTVAQRATRVLRHMHDPQESSHNPILIEGWRPVPKESWITFLAPFQEDEFIIFANSLRRGGVHVYSTLQDKTLKLNTIQGHIWGGDISPRGALLLAHDRDALSLCQLEVKGADLKLAAHEQLSTGQGRIEQVAWIPGHAEDAFAIRTRDTLTLWNAIRGRSPLRTIVSGEVVKDLAGSPADPYGIVCVLEREVRLYDIRSGQVSLSLPSRAHLVRWNPFIPFWLATASNDDAGGGINIHDLRYQRKDPLVVLPVRFTSDFCWSNANCELLLGSSSSRRVSLWSIKRGDNLEPQPISELPCGQCGGEITGLQPSLRHPNVFFATSLLSSLLTVQIGQDCIRSLAPIVGRPGQDNRLEHIERSLYCRDFDAVFKGLLELAPSTSPPQFESLQRLSNQTLPMLPIDADSWSVASLDEEVPATFWDDLARYSQGIPPGFYLRISEQPGAIEEVRFKVKVLEAIRRGDGILLAKLTGRIMSMLVVNSSLLDHPTLVSITGVLLSSHRLAGLRFGRQALDLIIGCTDNSRAPPSTISGDACALCHLLLFPTIFDVEAVTVVPSSRTPSPTRLSPGDCREHKLSAVATNAGDNVKNAAQPNTDQRKGDPSRSHGHHYQRQTHPPRQAPGRELLALRKFIRQPERARAMVDLEIALEEAIDDPERYSGVLLKGLQESLGGRTAAARTAFRCLEQLREQSQLESYLIMLSPYCQSPRTDFAYVLLEHMDGHVMPSLKYALSQAIDTHRPSLVLRALLLLVLLVEGRRPLPEALEPFLVDRLRRLLRALQGEDYSRMPGYGRLAKTVMSMAGEAPNDNSEIWKQISLLRDHFRSVN